MAEAQKSGRMMIAVLAVSVVALALSVWSLLRGHDKIGFVRSQELIYQYKGTLEAQDKLKARQQQWQAELDTLSQDFIGARDRYLLGRESMSDQEAARQEALVVQMNNNLMLHSHRVDSLSAAEDNRMMQGVLDQINAFVEKYAQEHGYSLILGSSPDGNILYGEPALDITQPVLEALNQDFEGGAPQP